jgi:prolyl 4-hydroxylase
MLKNCLYHFHKYSLLYFFVLLICIAMIYYFKKCLNEPFEESHQGIGRGFCSIESDYTDPVFYNDFISDAQAKAIIEKATPLFEESTIVSGGVENIRKSQTAWISKQESPVKEITEKVCQLTKTPFSHAEKMQIVKYDPNGFYNEHWDAACDDNPQCVEFEKNGGQRKITMLIYLNDDFEGGETRFPNLKKSFQPKKNGGLLFYSLENGGKHKCHPKALHAGVPVKSGQKYICNIWLREKPYVE